jgi:hypothetical protein
MSRLSATVSALAILGVLTSNPVHAVQRVFVASFGNDANTATNCNFGNPCRGFTAAMTVVDPGGEVVALDAAGYGAVVITKSVTLTANPGFYAGISASTGNAVTIATAGVNVILRNLNINGIGALNGVSMTSGDKLSIENCVISNFAVGGGAGVSVRAEANVKIVDSLIRDNYNGVFFDSGATALVGGSRLLGNSFVGVFARGNPTGTTTNVVISDTTVTGPYIGIVGAAVTGAASNVSVSRSTSSNNVYGVVNENLGGTAIMTVSNSMVTGNSAAGFFNSGAAFRSLGNNTVDQNSQNYSGPITVISGL